MKSLVRVKVVDVLYKAEGDLGGNEERTDVGI